MILIHSKRQIKKLLLEKPLRQEFIMKGGVVPPGIEPGTHGFSVRLRVQRYNKKNNPPNFWRIIFKKKFFIVDSTPEP